MDISIKRMSDHKHVSIEENSTKIDLGYLDNHEATQLARDFIWAAEDLLPAELEFAGRVLHTVWEVL